MNGITFDTLKRAVSATCGLCQLRISVGAEVGGAEKSSSIANLAGGGGGLVVHLVDTLERPAVLCQIVPKALRELRYTWNDYQIRLRPVELYAFAPTLTAQNYESARAHSGMTVS